MDRSILIFDDYPMASENKLFLMLLRKRVEPLGFHVVPEKLLRRLDEVLRICAPAVLILDIMSEVSRDFRSIEGGPVSNTLAGVEILRRCREGVYGQHARSMPVFMRTTRGEAHIKTLCSQLGATGYFQVGVEDKRLIETVVGVINS